MNLPVVELRNVRLERWMAGRRSPWNWHRTRYTKHNFHIGLTLNFRIKTESDKVIHSSYGYPLFKGWDRFVVEEIENLFCDTLWVWTCSFHDRIPLVGLHQVLVHLPICSQWARRFKSRLALFSIFTWYQEGRKASNIKLAEMLNVMIAAHVLNDRR